ncbi:MAG: AsmA family protein, partial [Planctomycetota bacterium]
MNATEKNKKEPTSKKRKKWWLWLLLAFVLVIVIFIALLPTIVSSEMISSAILAKINDAAPGRLDFTDLSMGWSKGIMVSDISYTDDAEGINVKVKQFAMAPHFGSILLGKINLGETVIDEPVISIDLKEILQPELDTQKQRSETTPAPQPMVALPVHQINLNINNGQFTATDPKGNSAQLDQINSNLSLKPPGQQSSFELDTNLNVQNKQSKVTAKAQITPDKKSGWTLKGATGNVNIEISDLDLASLEPFFALAELDLQANGTLAANLKSEIDQGQVQKINGTIKGEDLEISGDVLKSDRISSSQLDVDIQLQRKDQLVSIDQSIIRADWADISANGFLPTTLDSINDFLT